MNRIVLNCMFHSLYETQKKKNCKNEQETVH